MVKKIFNYLIVFSTFFLLLAPLIVNGEDALSSSPLKIDRHWIYIFQLDNYKTLEVNEYFYINNTGFSPYNKSLNIWIQNNSFISSNCCNFTPNFACRYNENGEGECFYLNKSTDGNYYIGNPFPDENLLSYHGQRELISITASSSTNHSLNPGTLNINATIGVSSFNITDKKPQESGIQLNSDNIAIGLVPKIDPYMPFKITKIENITIKNNSSDKELIVFNIGKLPLGWSAEIINGTNVINNLSLSSQEYKNLTLKISAPSNIASIYVRYFIELDNSEGKTKDDFKKKYLYDNDILSYEVYVMSTKDVEVSDDLNLVHDDFFWLEEYQRYWFIAKNENVQKNSFTNITFDVKKSSENNLFFYQIIILIILAGAIIGLLYLKKKNIFQNKESLKSEKNNIELKQKQLLEKKKKILDLIDQAKKDESLNLIDKKNAEVIITDYQDQLKKINQKITEFEKSTIGTTQKLIADKIKQKDTKIKELEEQKEKIYSAIKKVEREYKDKIIGRKDYELFRGAYKKKAVEILKEIEKLKE